MDWKIIEKEKDEFLLILYPFNNKEVTYGFNVKKKDLYSLYLDLKNIFEMDNSTNKNKSKQYLLLEDK